MAKYPNTTFWGQNPVTRYNQHRENLMALQGLAIGIMLGMGVYMAWNYGLIASFTQILASIAVGIRNMTHDITSVCGDLIQYVLSVANH